MHQSVLARGGRAETGHSVREDSVERNAGTYAKENFKTEFIKKKFHQAGRLEAQHFRQHAGHHGKVRVQLGRTCPGTYQPTDGGEKENGRSSTPDVAKVNIFFSLDIWNYTRLL